MTAALDTTLDENLAMIARLGRLPPASTSRRCIYDAEHFFDGFKRNREYALRTLLAAEAAGAHCLVLCDTNGGTLPHELVGDHPRGQARR